MCKVVERYLNGTEQEFEGALVRQNGHIVLSTKDGVVEIPESRVVELKQTPSGASPSAHEE